jgi:hypothetical protein
MHQTVLHRAKTIHHLFFFSYDLKKFLAEKLHFLL